MSATPVTFEQEGNIAIVTMDDGKANALSFPMMDGIDEALGRAAREAGAVVLTGRPGRFSAGFDLREMMAGVEQARAMVTRGAEMLLGLYGFPLPVVIACTGQALAAGALVLLCGDVRIGTRGAFKVGLNEMQIGMPTPILAMELARDRLAPAHLTEATLFGATVDPETALAWGYVDAVVDEADLRARALAEANRLAALSRSAYARTKAALREKTIGYVRDTLTDDIARLTPPAA